ncbi:protein FAM13B isoform X6 [Falco rusticolus]|uniref:protein FAM13B isoform X6 n=1 Tax=Falco rusticolus TaxID=120794 RepID=UPI000FFBA857|nr:protein FAM13B isoform X6 [Falco rusticolus]XP_055574361.1 protein FAM13B isoform X5 [Falco cherrug]
MRKSSSPSLSNCNSVLANKIFGIPLDELQQEGQPDNEVPFIVRHVVDYIEEHGGLEQEGLFQVNGNAETVEWLRQRYDNGEDVDLVKEADVPSAISLLRFFLQELPEPVIPGSLHIHLMQLSQDYNNEDEFGRKLRFLLQQLPPVNYSLLKFLCKFLANVASHHEEIWSASSLAAVFGPDVFHIYTDVEDLKEQEIVSRIMAGLLENYYEFFENEEEDFSSTNDLSSITEQINDLLEEEEDVKLEQSEELPEDGTEKPVERPAVVHLDMTGSLSDSRSVTASTSAHISPISILPASADILERTIRAAVEQHLFDLQSSLDNDLKHIQQHRLGCNNEAKNPSGDEEGSNNQNDVIEDNDTGSSENTGDCSEVLVCNDLGSETMKHDTVTEEEESVQVPALPSAQQTADVLLKPCDEAADVGGEDNSEGQNSILLGGNDRISSEMFLDSSSKTCDLNANTDSEVSGDGNINVSEEALGVQVPRLDLKNVSDGDKWEAPCPITFPLIDFKTMHLQREGEDPFPAFKSWQEDSESGEAQLSPQAGRMTNHPLEEDCHPILSHRSLDFGQSQRFLHDPETLDSSSKALSFVRTRRASFSSKDDKREDKTPYQLVKKLQKKIKQFEEQFEKEKNSKPSYSDIAANPKVLKWMTELTKLRKQIKDAKQRSSDGEFIPQTRPRSNTLPKSFGSSLDQEDEENGDEMRVVQKEKKPTKEATLELILKRLKEKRVERCLPEDIKKMTKDHLVEEKTSLQKSLLYYESQHGRPGSPSTKRRGQMLQPIIEGETAHFFEEIKEEEEESDGLSTDLNDILKTAVQTQSVLSPVENSESDVEDGQEKLTRDLRLSSTRAASMPELLEQLWKARAEKKKLRKTLREFEEEFYQQNGRNVQKEDRVPMLDEYREYKKIKAKLRLLEVLISKQDSSKSI